MIKILFILFLLILKPTKLIISLGLLAFTFILISFMIKHDQEWFIFYSSLSLDTLSFSLIRLSIFIIILIIISRLSNNNIIHHSLYFNLLLSSLLLCLVITFRTFNIIIFYITFEASLIPTFILILGWGNQPERSQAGTYIIIYTVLASLPLLVVFLIWSNKIGSTNIHILYTYNSNMLISGLWAFILILAFSVKLPAYLVHVWLPKAHVEAPVAGSIILAAILLKLGGYGLLRIVSKTRDLIIFMIPFIISWSLAGGTTIAFLCVFQNDIKLLIALSSVAHIALVIRRVLTFSHWGINGAQFIIIGHGFCSSGLFCIANITYERINSRSFFVIKGIQTILPVLSIIWFILCTSNIASPPSLNLIGEISSITAIFSWSYFLSPLLVNIVFLAAAYSLFLFSQSQHGKLHSKTQSVLPITLREWLILLLHWTPLNLLFLNPHSIQLLISLYNLYKILSCGLKKGSLLNNFNIMF